MIWPSMVHNFQVLDVGTDVAFTYGYLANMEYYLRISPVHAIFMPFVHPVHDKISGKIFKDFSEKN